MNIKIYYKKLIACLLWIWTLNNILFNNKTGENPMKRKNQPAKVDKTLRGQVLGIVDQLYNSMCYLNKNSNMISMQIIRSISSDYASQNCELHFIFEDIVKPYLRKMNENQRLEAVKGLLTNGYIDIDKQRIHMLWQPYLNYDEAVDSNKKYYITDIPDSCEDKK